MQISPHPPRGIGQPPHLARPLEPSLSFQKPERSRQANSRFHAAEVLPAQESSHLLLHQQFSEGASRRFREFPAIRHPEKAIAPAPADGGFPLREFLAPKLLPASQEHRGHHRGAKIQQIRILQPSRSATLWCCASPDRRPREEAPPQARS